jgi:RNase P/RNase MRP subunit POP5
LKLTKYRYIALKVFCSGGFDEGKVVDAVRNAVSQLFGEYGASRALLSFVSFDEERNYIILRCSHAALDMVRASTASITRIDNMEVMLHTVGVSGSLSALRRRLMQKIDKIF